MIESGRHETPRSPASDADRRLIGEQIVACCRVLVGEGLVGGFGHVSRRLDTDSFSISGRVPLGTLSPEEVVTVRAARAADSETAHLVPVEGAIHSAIYDARPDVHAIVRTHGDFCSVLSLLGEPVRAVHGFGATLGERVPVHDVCELIETADQAQHVAADLADAQAVSLRGNGAVVCGGDLLEACVLAVYLEESARLQYRARCVDSASTLRYLTAQEVAAASANLGSRPQLERAWKALCDRHHVTNLLAG